MQGSYAFHAGTKFKDGEIATDGGRVMAISSYGNSIQEALACSYTNAQAVDYEGKYYRKDLGFDLVK